MDKIKTNLVRKFRRKKELSAFLLIFTVFLVCLYKAKFSCVQTITEVNEKFKRLGFNGSCAKLTLGSAHDCDDYEKRTRKLQSEEFLDHQLDSCQSYIEQTKVNFHEEEKQYPLAFSILAHKDPVHFSK